MNNRAPRRARRLGLVATIGLATTIAVAAPALAANTASASVVGRTLDIRGSGGADNIVLSIAAGNPNTLDVDFENDGIVDQSFDRGSFDVINVSLGGGDDHFTANGVPLSQPSTITGGGGADTIIGTGGVDAIDGEGGNDNITSGGGDDFLDGGGGDDFAVGGVGHDVASLGGGNDTFVWNPGDGSDDFDGSGGLDRLLFNGAPGAETMSLSAVGTRAVFLRSPGNIVMNNDNVEVLDLNALGGIDLVTVNDLAGTDMHEARIDLSAVGNGGAGDGAVDSVTVNGTGRDDDVDVAPSGAGVVVSGLHATTNITGNEPADHLQVNTLDGNDTVTVDPGTVAVISVTTDLGPGQL
jgi:RTX calcium-binding nonapeptide repeat (4 copies)